MQTSDAIRDYTLSAGIVPGAGQSLAETHRVHGQSMLENLRKRMDLLQEIENNNAFAELERRRALSDIFYWIEHYAYTHETRPATLGAYGLSSPTLPFLLFPFQRDYISRLCASIEQGRDLLTEKSRDMGASWLIITVFLWYWLQDAGGNDFLIGSRKQDFVDRKGAQDTIFEKFRYNLYLQPAAFLPLRFNSRKHDNVLLIQNPETGSYVRGEGNNPHFGTGGRYKAIMMDEYAKWEETDKAAWTSTNDASPCRLPTSTPNGMGNKYAQLRFSGAIQVLTLHWSLHPLKNPGLYEEIDADSQFVRWRSAWYDREIQRRSDDVDRNIAQELDIDYLRSGMPYFNNRIISDRLRTLEATPPAVKRYMWEFQSSENGKHKINLIEREDGPIHVAAAPVLSWRYRYCISADVAEGLEKGDNSAFVVFDRATGKDVVWFSDKIDTHVYAHLLHHFSSVYGKAYLAPESNNHGHAVIQTLKGITDRIMHEQEFREFAPDDFARLGHRTDQVSRPIQLAGLRESIYEGSDGIQDIATFRECMTFVYGTNGKPQADGDCLDDRVLAQSIKFMLHKWLPAPKAILETPAVVDEIAEMGRAAAKKDHRRIW